MTDKTQPQENRWDTWEKNRFSIKVFSYRKLPF